MIEKYIYAVTKELPKNAKEETAIKLRELILKKINLLDEQMTQEEKIDLVLKELGDPKALANKYRGRERYLIGPMYFDAYLSVLKIVALSTFIGISIASGIAVVFSVGSLVKFTSSYVGTLITSLAQGVVWVTGIFAFIEYSGVSLEKPNQNQKWDPSQLAELPEKKARISRGESIFTIVFTTIILPIFFLSSDRIGFYFKIENQTQFFPLFNPETIPLFRIVIVIIFILTIIVELLKLVKGRWTLRLAITITVLDVLSSLFLISAISSANIWDNGFIRQFESYAIISFNRLITLIVGVIVITTILGAISALYKGYKYGNKQT